MVQPKGSKAVVSPTPEPVDTETGNAAVPTSTSDEQAIEDIFAALKTLLNTVEKLQKARQGIGDIKPSLIRLLDGELLSGEELDPLKEGVSGLSKLVKLYSDYQDALEKAQPARELLDKLLKI